MNQKEFRKKKIPKNKKNFSQISSILCNKTLKFILFSLFFSRSAKYIKRYDLEYKYLYVLKHKLQKYSFNPIVNIKRPDNLIPYNYQQVRSDNLIPYNYQQVRSEITLIQGTFGRHNTVTKRFVHPPISENCEGAHFKQM